MPDIPLETVRSFVQFWTNNAWVLDQRYGTGSLTGDQPDRIVNAIKLLYDSSETFRRWVDPIIASGGKLRFGAATVDPPDNLPGSTRAIGDGATGYTNLNFSTIDASCWINTTGELVQERLEITIAHEFSHLFEDSKDAVKPFTDQVRNQAGYDFEGSAIRWQNQVIKELRGENTEQLQTSYGSMGLIAAGNRGLVFGKSYTDSQTIDVFRRGDDEDADIINHTGRTAGSTNFSNDSSFPDPGPQLADLIFGFGGADEIWGGLGNDHLFGGRGDEVRIDGGEGDDRLFGGAGNDLLDGGLGNDFIQGGTNAFYSELDGTDMASDGVDTADYFTSGIYTFGIEVGIGSEFDPAAARFLDSQNPDLDRVISVKDQQNGDEDYLLSIENIEGTNGDDIVRIDHLSSMFLANANGQGGLKSIDLKGNGDVGDEIGAYLETQGLSINLTTGRVALRSTPGVGFTVLGAENVSGGYGNDEIIGDEHDNILVGGDGNDVIDGGGGTNIIDGGAGIDTIRSRGHNDIIRKGERGSPNTGAMWLGKIMEAPSEESRMVIAFGATTTIEDSNKNDRVFYANVQLTGGVAPWWDESNIAVDAPMTNLAYAFPSIGSELIAAGSLFADAPWMKFAMYRQEENGDVTIRLGYGLAGYATLKNYQGDLKSGGGTGGLTIFRQGGHGRTAAVDQQQGNYVNLALKAGWGPEHGLDGMDPLVLDLDGDGFDVTAREYSQVYFDFDGNGFAKQTGWVLGDDALLARDVDANGTIDSGAELFGNRTTSGFTQLAALDSNSDGVINASDADFATLRVWRDLNQDGVSQAEELQTLAQAGITAISLNSTATEEGTEVRGNPVARTATFTRADGSTDSVGDVTLNVSDMNTRWAGTGDASAAALALPQLGGLGRVRDLRHAMTDDATLLTLVNNLAGSTGATIPALLAQVEAILYRWAGVESVAADPLGSNGLDERKLAFLETYNGVALVGRDAQGQIITPNLTSVEDLWNYEFPRLALKLIAQGPMADDFAGLSYNEELDQFVAAAPDTIATIIDSVLDNMPAVQADAQAYWADWGQLLGAMAGSVLRSSGANVSSDFFFAQLVAAADGRTLPLTLVELAATLAIDGVHIGSQEALTRDSGDNGTQVWFADQANAVMTGGGGQDAYIFGHSIGNAVITDQEARESGDRIRFAFLDAGDVTMARSGNDLIITVTATGETVRVVNQFAPVVLLGSDNIISSNKGVEDIQFADGTILEGPEIAIAVGKGTSGNDHLVGTMHTDVLQGMAGDDLLEGGDDADLYYVEAGGGHDTIRETTSTPYLRGMDMLIFGEGITPQDLVFSREGANMADLRITYGVGDSVLIDDQFAYTSLGYNAALALNTRVDAFSFRNYAETWSSQQVEDLLIQQSVTDGADTTYGFGNDDTFYASAGNDTLVGYDGADTYQWGVGSGSDTIDEQALYIDVEVGLGGISLTTRADTVVFGEGITADDVIFKSALGDADLHISLVGSADSLLVKNQFAGFQTGVLGAQWFDRVEWFEFADGTRLSWQDVLGKVTTGTAGNDELRGDLFADTFRGGAGNDIMSGKGLGDTYIVNLGDGQDVIDDANTEILGDGFITLDGTPDVLQFGAGIAPSDITFQRNGADLILLVGASGDKVTLKGQDAYIQTGVFGAISYTRVEEVRFADGTVWTWQQLNQHYLASLTTSGNDSIFGFTMDDRFEASAGDDILMGGESADTYVFGVGSGHDIVREAVSNVLYDDTDTIEFAGSILPAGVTLTRNGDDLTLSLASGDSITIEGEFAYQAYFTWTDVERFTFTNGTLWTIADVRAMLLASTSGNDTLTGFGSDDLLDGGAGNDLLIGADGGDTYKYDRGYGNDTIRESVGNTNLSEADRVVFGPGIVPADLAVSRSGDDLIFTITATGETLTVEDQFAYSNWFAWQDVERFEFADGTVWTSDDVARRLTGGTPGDDHIVGTFGADTIDGGAGTDLLEGGDGGDIYIFGRGYGSDTIRESLSNANLSEDDRVIFASGVVPADLVLGRNGDTLTIGIAGTSATLTIEGEFAYQAYFTWTDVDRFEFADGTIWTKQDVQERLLAAQSTPGNDTIVGFGSDDVIDGGAGNDLLQGGDGSDTYRFGRGDGNDQLVESLGNFNLGEYDVIALDAGIAPGDVTLSRSGNDLILTLDTGETLTVTSHFVEGTLNSTTVNDIEEIRFADGTVWDKPAIATRYFHPTGGNDTLVGTRDPQTIDGAGGNDTITAGGGDDTLIGGTGNDLLQGQGGDDIYVYNSGDGSDIIREAVFYDGGGTDRIRLGVGILPANVTVTSADNGNDFLLSIAGGGSILIDQAVSDSTQRVEYVEFADGTTWTYDDLIARVTSGTPGDDTIVGDNNNNTIFAGAGNDTVKAAAGDDILIGGTGNDTLQGQGGNDTYRFSTGDGQDVINEPVFFDGSGIDTVEFTAGITPAMVTVTQATDGTSLVLTYGTGDSVKLLNTLNDGGSRIEQVRFADGTLWTHAQLVQMSIASNGGNDTFYGSYDTETLDSGVGNDTIQARAGDDIIIGGAGNDTLQGQGGNDTYRFSAGDGQDVINEPAFFDGSGIDTVEFTAGITPAMVTVTQAADGASLVLTYGTGDSVKLLNTLSDGGSRIEQVRFADGTTWTHAQLVQMSIANNGGNDTFYGSYDTETLSGGAGNDTIQARAGDDILIGGTGNDTLQGQGGNDTYRFSTGDGQDVINEPAFFDGSGTDMVEFTAGITPAMVTVTQAADGASLVLTYGTGDSVKLLNTLSDGGSRIEQVRFADGTLWTHAQLVQMSIASNGGNDTFYGSYDSETLDGGAGNDVIQARAGDDILIGGAGNDTLQGQAGNDTYRFGLGGGHDVVTEAVFFDGGGSDTIELGAGITPADVTVTAPDNGASLMLTIGTGADTIKMTNAVTDANNRIETVRFADGTLWSYADLVARISPNTPGPDILTGTSGNDTLSGGGGDDSLSGLAGDDTLNGDADNDALDGGAGNDVLNGGTGTDTATYASATAGVTVNLAVAAAQNTVGAGTDTLSGVESLTGSSFNDTLTGDGNANTLLGGGGNDLIEGGAGNDVLDGGAGTDTLSYASAGAAVSVSLSLASAQATGGAGTDTVTGFENLTGSAFNDTLTGESGANSVTGGAGNDTIDGAAGDDVLDGGAGTDTASYASAAGGVTVSLATAAAQNTGGNGTDTLTGFENLTGSAFADTLAGDANANVIAAGAGNDSVEGAAGNDTLDGGAGTDTLSYASATAAVTVNLSLATAQNTVGAGTDTITAFENLTGSGFADTLTGDSTANNISGGAGNDIIDGGTGDDLLEGGAGDDKLTGGTGIDTVSYASATAGVTVSLANTKAQNTVGAGSDTLATLENLVGSGLNDTLTGSTVDNVINGGAGNDVIDGGSGNDTLDGGTGNDTLTGNTGTDTVSYASAASAVTVSLALTAAQNTVGAGTDTIATVENLTGSAFDDALTGNASANTITGGAGNDTISGGAGTDIAKVAGLRASYTLQTVNGQVQLVDNDAVTDGNDGTDTLVGIETVQFKDQSMGIVSPIILDLGGDGIETRSAEQSSARFDMNGDGRADDTSWIGASEGFLYLDRDGNGALSGIAEMSFTADVAGADSDLAGLAAFDSNGDGKLSAEDARFGDFGVWRDGDGDGAVDRGELMKLSDIGLASISLGGAATATTVAPGGVAVVSTGSWTRTDGTVMDLADAKMTYFAGAGQPPVRPQVGHGPALQTLLALRDEGFFAEHVDWREWSSALREADDRLAPGRLVAEPLTESVQHNPAFTMEPVPAGMETERRVALMTQDLAAFGGDSSASVDPRHWDQTGPFVPNLA